MRTGTITYNVRERGRQHRGAERNFDTVTLARLINSGSVQERVKNRDMHGYYGHWPRLIFGMNPVEGGIHEGRQVTLEPALTMLSVSASDDGTITYEVEFNANPPGRVAHRLWQSKRGGFSSAIDAVERNGVHVPIAFYGVDYVYEPNYTTNRGYVLDSVAAVEEGDRVALLDCVAAEMQAAVADMDRDHGALQSVIEQQAQTLVRLQTENNELLGMLAKRGATPTLDSVGSGFSRPMRAGFGGDFASLVNGFSNTQLAGYAPLPGDGDGREQVQAVQDAADSVLRKWG